MKLYTEEEIRKFFTEKYDEGLSIDELIEILTPIELPSDEEIKEMRKAYLDHVNTITHKDLERDGYLNVGFHVGAKSMRDKIQGGNNDKQ
jgi:hypothetical protein